MPVIVKTDFVIDQKVVALTGADHVIVPIRAQFDRPVQLFRRHRRHRCEQVRLGFLAAKAAAHAAHLNDDVAGRNTKDMGDHVLNLGRMLGR